MVSVISAWSLEGCGELAFYGAGGHAADDVALEDEGQHNRRDGSQDAAGHHTGDVDGIAPDEFSDGHRGGLGRQGAGEDQSVEELIPGQQEDEHGGGDQAGDGDGHHNAEDDPQAGAAIQTGGFLQLDRHGLEKNSHHPDAIRQCKAQIRYDQHDGFVDPFEARGDDEQWQHQRDFRDHARAQNAKLNGAVQFERDAHQRIGCQAADPMQMMVTIEAILKEFIRETAKVRGTVEAARLGKKISR